MYKRCDEGNRRADTRLVNIPVTTLCFGLRETDSVSDSCVESEDEENELIDSGNV